jgi:hypothetical protein
MATAKGHLQLQRKNVRSTKSNNKAKEVTEFEDEEETSSSVNAENTAFTCILDLNDQTDSKCYSDLTGKFPHRSQDGNLYVAVLYLQNDNAILVEPLAKRTDRARIDAYTKLFTRAKQSETTLTLHFMDNEASKAVKTLITQDFKLNIQLVPPNNHRTNAAERAIRTFKDHFVAGLCSTAPDFPIRLWDRLLPQAEITLNLLRQSNVNPTISAYEALNGPFDHNRTPLSPPGCKILVHERSNQRGSWAAHGVEGWYLGPAMEHYRCHRCYIKNTQSERVSDTVEFFPEIAKLPTLSPFEAAVIAIERLTTIIESPTTIIPQDGTALQQLHDALIGDAMASPTPLSEKSSESVQPSAAAPRVADHAIDQPSAPPPRVAKPQPANTPVSANTRGAANRQTEEQSIFNSLHQANSVMHPVTGVAMEYRQLIKDPLTKEAWLLSSANEFGRLAQGVGGRITGTDTIQFVPHSALPAGKRATYPRFVCTERPQKAEPNRTRLTLGGNLIDYDGDVSVGTAEMDTIKVLLNSVVSTPEAKFCTADVTNFYLNTPMDEPEFVLIHISLIPQEIIDEYNLMEFVNEQGYVLVQVSKGMYGLPQAGALANRLLKVRLDKHGYFECEHTPGLWRHLSRKIFFALVVDDFGIQYIDKADAQHLIAALKQDYEAVTVDWSGSLFCGITLQWDYTARTVDLSMPGYVEKALNEFHKLPTSKPEHQPYRSKDVQYGVKSQMTDPLDTSPQLDKSGVLWLQRITGTFLYYARAVDPTMLVALSALALEQAKGTERTAQDAVKFLNYCATHPDATIRYRASDMILSVHSDASYLSETKARSRSGGFFHMGSKDRNTTQNGPLLATTAIMKVVVSSAAEAEIGALFENCKKATILRTTLSEMGWPQPATPMQTDNSTACGIANSTIKQQRSRAIDMRFYWVRDRVQQGQFDIFWAPGSTNLADYFTKHHPAKHHQSMRPIYLHVKNNTTIETTTAALAAALQVLQGCAKTPQCETDSEVKPARGASQVTVPPAPAEPNTSTSHARQLADPKAKQLANGGREKI